MRPVVSYDDIATPQPTAAEDARNPSNPPPPKKRKRNNSQKNHNKRPQQNRYPQQHWDDPGASAQNFNYNEGDNILEGAEVEAEIEVNRELTHEEIWDDSALIDAWNAAAEEYESYHGPDKSWKDEPVHKSALWYNVPLSPSSIQAPVSADTQPLDFNTFVPTHDASLESGAPTGILPPPGELSEVTQDEAFSKAMNAMYWTGYWTAIYHTRQNQLRAPDFEGSEGAGEEEDMLGDAVTIGSGDFVPSQR